MTDLTLNAALVRRTLTDFIRTQVAQAGMSHAVLGLSGGIDSALACCLAAEALGPENVLAVRMPYRTSSADSLEDAQRVIDATGVLALTIPITAMVEPLFERFPEMSAVRRGNIMARTRMVALFDQSAAFNALVVGTGNKTEALLGYTTLYGDSACAFNPLGDLYKTQVRQLSQALGVPSQIMEKAPSADLWQGQTDEGELGFTYAEVDRLLFELVEERRTPVDCIAMGFAPDFVQAVINRIRRNRFKAQLPPIPRINRHPTSEELTSITDK